ncbi:MAG: AAA family ATPase [Verrucomicrobiales bacterium]
MITKIEAVNFRCLKNISQVLGGFHVITGPNGSGKSTFLDVPRILAAYAAEGIDAVWDVSRAESLNELLHQGEGSSVQWAVEARIPESIRKSQANGKESPFHFVRYEVEIGWAEDTDQPPKILGENLWLLPKSNVVPRDQLVQQELLFPSSSRPDRRLMTGKTPKGWVKSASKTRLGNAYFKDEKTKFNLQIRNPTGKSALSTLPEDEMRFPLSNWFKSELITSVQRIMLRSELMQASASPLKDRRFAVDGSNLPQVLRELKKDKPSWSGWLDHVGTVLPIKDIEVEEIESTRSLFLVVEYKSGHRVNSWHLSDGTLRLLALTLLAYIKNPGAVYLIEEPENGIHPQAIEAVFQSLSALDEGQALVATHSPVLVAQVSPEQLLCFSKSGDQTDILAGNLHPKLKNWKGGIQLSQLYAAGILS